MSVLIDQVIDTSLVVVDDWVVNVECIHLDVRQRWRVKF